MTRNRWILGGALAAVGLVAGGVFLLRPRPADPGPTAEPPPPPPPVTRRTPPHQVPLLDRWTRAVRENPRQCLQLESALRMEEDRYRDELVGIAREDANPRVRAFTVSVLGRFRTPPPESFFLAVLTDEHEYPRASAVAALERIGTPASVAELERIAARDPVKQVRSAAGRAAAEVRLRDR